MNIREPEKTPASVASTPTSRPVITQEWSLHAEVTFSHDAGGGGGSAGGRGGGGLPARHPSADSGVFTSCSWGNAPSSRPQNTDSGVFTSCSWGNTPSSRPQTTDGGTWGNNSTQTARTQQTLHPCYGFQRGNILFTTTPPSRQNQFHQGCTSYSTYCGTNPSPRSPQPYNRRCKSTCSIVLSGAHDAGVPAAAAGCGPGVDRGNSCSPVPRCYHTLTHRCGDPVCYHASCPAAREEGLAGSEACEVCGGGRSPTAARRASRANTFTTHFCTRVPARAHSFGGHRESNPAPKESRDAAIQTSEPLTPSSSVVGNPGRGLQADNLRVPGDKKAGKKLSRSPARLGGKTPLLRSRHNSVSDGSRTSSPEPAAAPRRPRTVHIDVYCTGSEDADASDASETAEEEGDSWSSPQTVFESDMLRVTHTRAGKTQLPQALQQQQQQQELLTRLKSDGSRRAESFKATPARKSESCGRGFDSDDGLSSHYPSKQSSYTTFQDTESSILSDSRTASRDPSSSTISSSSCALPGEEYDSAAASSWKDTGTEVESAIHSAISLAQSDSFEYADAADRLRIREKERAWAGAHASAPESKTWHSPDTERRHLLQQQKLKAFMDKHVGKEGFPLWKPETADDSEEDGDETGDAWVFGSTGSMRSGASSAGLKREQTVKKAGGEDEAGADDAKPTPVSDELRSLDDSLIAASLCLGRLIDRAAGSSATLPHRAPHRRSDSGSLSDSSPARTTPFGRPRFVPRDAIGPFGARRDSPPPAPVGTTVESPFAASRGFRCTARKFGTVVGAFRKPGHHVGPARNPECGCEHCRLHFEQIATRGRARSLGDVAVAPGLAFKTS